MTPACLYSIILISLWFYQYNLEKEFCYKVTDFYHPGDEGGLAWNDPEIGIEWPEVQGAYPGSADASGYTMDDGTKLNLSDKDQKWATLKDTWHF